MAKIIDFNKFKAEQTYKKSANEILDFDVDLVLDLSNEWDNAGAENNSHSNYTWSKLFRTILISIKKCLTLKVLKIEHRFDSIMLSNDESYQ